MQHTRNPDYPNKKMWCISLIILQLAVFQELYEILLLTWNGLDSVSINNDKLCQVIGLGFLLDLLKKTGIPATMHIDWL